MATGILGQANPTASTDTTVYTVPAATTGTFNISVNNTGNLTAIVNVAIAAAATPTAAEYIEWETTLGPGAVLERTAIVAQATKRVVVNCSTSNCAVSVYGYEA